MEQNSDGIEIGRNKVGIIHLVNTFVNDRTYELRGEKDSYSTAWQKYYRRC